MQFSLAGSLEILERTPAALTGLLLGLSDGWTLNNEGGDTWSAFDIVGHLIHADRTNWLSRAEIILSGGARKSFEPFDRFAQFEISRGKRLEDLLEEFGTVRASGIERLKKLELQEADLSKTAHHPALGIVTLRELLSAWVVHDLSHIAQVSRVLAVQYRDQVGPFSTYLSILKS